MPAVRFPYNAPMGVLYDVTLALVAAITSPVWGYRLLRTGKWRTDWPGRFGQCRLTHTPPSGDPPTLLVHAVSVGEVNAFSILVDRLAETSRGPSGEPWRIVIASTTNTGVARARELFADRYDVVRYPLDFSPCIRRFLTAGPRIRVEVVGHDQISTSLLKDDHGYEDERGGHEIEKDGCQHKSGGAKTLTPCFGSQ